MANYLENRKQRVIVNGSHSNWIDVASGVPQGATLGPPNFYDLPDELLTGTKCGIFADDTTILRHVTTNHDMLTLQRDINKLFDWSIKWGLQFNTDKCMVMTVKRTHSVDKLNNPIYTMNDKPLDVVKDIRDLGIIINDSLSWITHIYKMVSKALGFHAPRRAKKLCYIAMVCSIMEYGSIIWSPTYKFL